MKGRLASGRVWAKLRPARAASTVDKWSSYLALVEPALAGRPRVHRFARPPVLGAVDTRPLPIGVWIDGEGEAAAITRAALRASTVGPLVVLGGPLQEALAQTRCERLMVVRAGDQPAPLALERLGQAAALAPDAAIITCDDDEISPDGARMSPCFRPGPSPDRWLACDDSGALLVVQRQSAVAEISTLSSGPGWRHELALSLAGRASERHAHVPLLLCHRAVGGPDEPALATAGAARALHRWEPTARLEQTSTVRRVRRPASREPSVEVIICFRDRPELLAPCVDSVLGHTGYERVSLALVDNGSRSQEMATLLERVTRDPRVRLMRDPRSFNFAALNNAAARSSDADVLVFLNNDTEVIDQGWIGSLLEEALRPEVGAVGPMLLYRDGSVQHAGAAIGLHEYAGHPFSGLRPDQRTPFGYPAQGTRNWLAVSAACMMIECPKFYAVGGFDETFVVAGNDVDICLRLTAAGHRSLCIPHVTLVHDESRSRGDHIDPGDFVASRRSYGAFRTVGDPFYNPNLTLRSTDCAIRTPDEELP